MTESHISAIGIIYVIIYMFIYIFAFYRKLVKVTGIYQE